MHLSPTDDAVGKEYQAYLDDISKSLSAAGRFSDSKVILRFYIYNSIHQKELFSNTSPRLS